MEKLSIPCTRVSAADDTLVVPTVTDLIGDEREQSVPEIEN
jgi:hypothetical protein